MSDQVLTVEQQNELKFKELLRQNFTTYVRLTNPTNDTVLFKIKITAPTQYCVRPYCGALGPKSRQEIAITPKPVYLNPNENHKHKFMVQSVVATEENTDIDLVWKEINPEQLMDYKLKCVFETPRETNLKLQEELLILRQSAGDGRVSRPHSHGPERTEEVAVMPWVITSLFMALIGYVIGKFVSWPGTPR